MTDKETALSARPELRLLRWFFKSKAYLRQSSTGNAAHGAGKAFRLYFGKSLVEGEERVHCALRAAVLRGAQNRPQQLVRLLLLRAKDASSDIG